MEHRPQHHARSAFDWAGGLAVAVLGAAVAWMAAGYGAGTLSRPGPGFFPRAGGLLLVALGLGVALTVREVVPTGERMRWRAAAAIFAAVLVWALLLGPLGLVPATGALTVVAALAHHRPNPRRVAATLVILPILGWAVFIKGLGLPVEAFAFGGF